MTSFKIRKPKTKNCLTEYLKATKTKMPTNYSVTMYMGQNSLNLVIAHHAPAPKKTKNTNEDR